MLEKEIARIKKARRGCIVSTNVALSLKKDAEWGEWVVSWFDIIGWNGTRKRSEEKSYRTDDFDDAIGTMRLMLKNEVEKGADILVETR